MEGRLSDQFRARTKQFATFTIRFYARLPKQKEEVRILGKQLLRSGTSVAAHVREASRGRSDAEFASKLGGAVQEIDESLLWLELLREECQISGDIGRLLEKEASELIAIMTTMIKRTNQRAQKKEIK